jgi:hypothetical protein
MEGNIQTQNIEMKLINGSKNHFVVICLGLILYTKIIYCLSLWIIVTRQEILDY